MQWNDRQFHLPGHVANKITQGASRNLVVRHGASKLTAEGIRDDLEHIHNLVVIDVAFKGADVHIATNSVHNALFARTCMMSRAAYKGMKIEYGRDECAAPLPRDTNRSRPSNATPAKKPEAQSLRNMFSALSMDETEDSSEVLVGDVPRPAIMALPPHDLMGFSRFTIRLTKSPVRMMMRLIPLTLVSTPTGCVLTGPRLQPASWRDAFFFN